MMTFMKTGGVARHVRYAMAAGCTTLALAAASPVDASAVSDVNQALIQSIQVSAMAPPVAARAIAMVEIAMYDAVNAATGSRYTPYSYTGSTTGAVDPRAAALAAGYGMLASIFPEQSGRLLAERDAHLATLNLAPGKLVASVSFGSMVCDDLFASRTNDGSLTAQTPYVFGDQPGDFQSVAPDGADPLLPGWGEVNPFVIASGDQFRLGPPPAIGSDEWIAAYEEVKAIGCVGCAPQELHDIGYFWADGPGTLTPPGHWLQIAQDAATAKGLGLMQEIQALAAVGAAVADGGIAGWDMKYAYDYWRPVTAIQNCTVDICGVEGDPDWVPAWTTPNFPSYISGHSIFSASAAGALASVFGSDMFDFCVTADPIVPLGDRCFTSFSEAAAEAGMSRIYGGIHYAFDNDPALAVGHELGRYITANAFRLTAVPEPATWAMLVAGFGLVGFSARRRRAAATPA